MSTIEERTAIRIGAWKAGERCTIPRITGFRLDPSGTASWPTCTCGWDGYTNRSQLWVAHDIPCPIMGSLEMVVAKLEWLLGDIGNQQLVITKVPQKSGPVYFVCGSTGPTLSDALDEYIDSLTKED